VQPSPGSTDTYTLVSGSTVGVARVGDLTVELRPKVGTAAVLFLVSYALDPKAWKPEDAQLAHDANLAEAIIPLFARTTRQALRPGLLHGYRRREDTLTTVRGRIRVAEQIRTRTGLPLPLEVVYDDFTPDILENQLLHTAVSVLGRLHLRHPTSRQELARLRQQLNGISTVAGNRRDVPEPHWTRLNQRYRPAVSLARLIIHTSGLEVRAGGADASAFLVDMNAVFERFIRVALREQLGLDTRAFPAAGGSTALHLDIERSIKLEPDLSWWTAGRCIFAGDCKYKRTGGTVPNADIYQMLAYLTALQLDDGLLVYAAGEDAPRIATIRHASKLVHVRTVDVSQAPTEVLTQVQDAAHLIRGIATDLPSAALRTITYRAETEEAPREAQTSGTRSAGCPVTRAFSLRRAVGNPLRCASLLLWIRPGWGGCRSRPRCGW
jgi:5-methylcytosine-specific restriction enzyme subunit McrC